MKKVFIPLIALVCSIAFAQTPMRATVQAKGPDGFFGPVIPNNLVLTIKNQILTELKAYMATNQSITVEDVINSQEFNTAVSNSCATIVTPEMIQEIVGTNAISEAQADIIINDTHEIKADNEQFKVGFGFITNVNITADMSVEELKGALITIVGGMQKALGGETNVVIHATEP